jgi:hypothetical protein
LKNAIPLQLLDQAAAGGEEGIQFLAQRVWRQRAQGLGLAQIDALRRWFPGQVMGHGRIVFEGIPEALKADAYTRREWLEV